MRETKASVKKNLSFFLEFRLILRKNKEEEEEGEEK